MDGGQSLKRSANAGTADTRTFETDYRIAPEEVDLYADEVKRRIVPKKMVRPLRTAFPFLALTSASQGRRQTKPRHLRG